MSCNDSQNFMSIPKRRIGRENYDAEDVNSYQLQPSHLTSPDKGCLSYKTSLFSSIYGPAGAYQSICGNSVLIYGPIYPAVIDSLGLWLTTKLITTYFFFLILKWHLFHLFRQWLCLPALCLAVLSLLLCWIGRQICQAESR